MKPSSSLLLRTLAVFALPALAHAAPQITSVAGADAAAISADVAAFRATLGLGGGGNGGAAGPFAKGFRNVNWDGAPDSASAPNLMPGNFFNSNAPRGLVCATPGTGLMMSADSDNPTNTAVRFSDLDPSYATSFQTFSGQRLFAAEGSTVIDCWFYVPSSPTTRATVNGFGVVFADVDVAEASWLEFWDAEGNSLGKWKPKVADGGLSFLGVVYDGGERVARVRITHGNVVLGAGQIDAGSNDVVVTDDFMYGEPLPLWSKSAFSNMSNRGWVGTGDRIMVGGLVIDGPDPKTVLVRAVGPGLAQFMDGTLTNPVLSITDSNGEVVATNNDWSNDTQVAEVSWAVGAFPLAADSADAATVVVLKPGAYTVQVWGVGGTTGVALVEAYEF